MVIKIKTKFSIKYYSVKRNTKRLDFNPNISILCYGFVYFTFDTYRLNVICHYMTLYDNFQFLV